MKCDILSCSPRPVVVGGDLSVHSVAWGSPCTDTRSRLAQDFAAGLGLVLLNRGRVSTFVGGRGESIVDITWASTSALNRVNGWKVESGSLGELSDHMSSWSWSLPPRRCASNTTANEKKSDGSSRNSTLKPSRLVSLPPLGRRGEADLRAEEKAERLCAVVSQACDASMPCRRPMARRASYWWSAELTELRRPTVAARQAHTHAKRRCMEEEMDNAAAVLRGVRKALRTAVARAKAAAWKDLISKLNRDPWGRPYQIVMKRFCPWALPVLETLHLQFLGEVVNTLFSTRGRDIPEKTSPPLGWTEELKVSNHEMAAAFARIRGRARVPGPDGVPPGRYFS
ncbi:uncharacterized protein LOC105202612 [Solenopsis invicta]|uniref:uncharacterized protein LOC105202612 n=1 Tax=Solenopsis invicta TaxID=13686 RepID=UPI000595B607|nr:uncharacterized protein LOC105202612 [Solenopsis invicta]